jgi:polysaccharide biosynthesis/export protein
MLCSVNRVRKSKCFFFLCYASSVLSLFISSLSGEESIVPKTSPSYQLSVLDQLSIQVFGEPDLSTSSEKSKRIDANGYVNIPLIGDVKLAGMTVREAELMIEKLFVEQRYLVNPQVSIDVSSYYVRKVSVLGEVNHPGTIEFRQERHTMDIAEVIALAGGFTGIAKSSEVLITRVSETGEKQTFKIDAIQLIRGQGKDSKDGKTQGFDVYADDVVFVPERLF